MDYLIYQRILKCIQPSEQNKTFSTPTLSRRYGMRVKSDIL